MATYWSSVIFCSCLFLIIVATNAAPPTTKMEKKTFSRIHICWGKAITWQGSKHFLIIAAFRDMDLTVHSSRHGPKKTDLTSSIQVSLLFELGITTDLPVWDDSDTLGPTPIRWWYFRYFCYNFILILHLINNFVLSKYMDCKIINAV